MKELIIIGILIFLNGLLAMAEIALVSVKKIRLKHKAEKGDQAARSALDLATQPDRFFSTIQIGITLIGILTGLFTGEAIKEGLAQWFAHWPVIADYSHSIATIAVVFIITYFSLVLGELVPKQLGLAHPETIAKFMARPMKWLSTITFPFIWLLSISSKAVVKLFRIKTSEDVEVTEEEIIAMINQGTISGAVEEAEQDIIERVFLLGDRNITSLMTHRSEMAWLDIDDPPEVFKQKVRESPHSIYPVCEGQIDNMVGVVHVKDLYLAEEGQSLKDIMRKPLFVPDSNTAYQVIQKFKQFKTHAAFIVDEYGSMVGMITVNDILEGLVGDMPDQDESESEIVKRDDGTYLIDAHTAFYDFLEYFDRVELMEEIEEGFDTLAGFLLNQLGHIPHTGEKVAWKDFCFEVVDMDGHRIDKVLVSLQPAANQKANDDL
ncbi:MAG: hemolysin family protein [Thermoflavifilum sp.]|nr:hemolysin family protein [Thermoflavifilum sp.]